MGRCGHNAAAFDERFHQAIGHQTELLTEPADLDAFIFWRPGSELA